MGNLTRSYLALTLVGIAVAVYHAFDELTRSFNACNISSSVSCGGVFESGETALFGVPFYALGLIWFPLMLALGLFALRETHRPRADVILPALIVGDIFTLYLWYLELGVIRIICPVCVALYIVNYGMTVVAALSLREG